MVELRKVSALSSAFLFLCSILQANAGVPDPDGVCDGTEPAGVQCETVAGPGSFSLAEVVRVGVGFCQDEDDSVPLYCQGNPDAINGAGVATFGSPAWAGQKLLNINVVHDQESCTAATSPPCGFSVSICNDRDQDSTCTSVGHREDEVYSASGQGFLGCDDKKGCASPNEVGWEGCMDDSIFSDWSGNQVLVFIGSETGAIPSPPDIRATAVAGTYTVWLEDKGACIQGPDPFPSSGCLWERAGIGGVTEVCANEAGPLTFACDGVSSSFLIVLHVGASGATSAVANTCSPQSPQTAGSGTVPSFVNVQAATGPGTFQCTFTWALAGAGGCFLDSPVNAQLPHSVQMTLGGSDGGSGDNPQCSDGRDNDGNGDTDFPADAGCGSAADNGERAQTQCEDGVDNDGDGDADLADDDCFNASDTNESGSSDCDDGVDDDGDGATDFPDDPGCDGASDASELDLTVQCDDGLDNDDDGATDFPDDPGCSDPADAGEVDAVLPCDDGLDNDGDGVSDFGPAKDPGCSSSTDPSEQNAAVDCDDGVDDDGDGAADSGPGKDPGCSSPLDPSELNPSVECDDGLDNDRDGLVDAGAGKDPGCSALADTSELNASVACDDGMDNDGDLSTDYGSGPGRDPGCSSPTDSTETT